jgi:PAS domain S-box-containing protein
LTALLNDAAAMAAVMLATDYSAILQLLPEGDELVLRAGVGWKEGLMGLHRVPATVGAEGGLVLHSDAPIGVPDGRPEKGVDRRRGLREQRVIAATHVIVRGRNRPWGVLKVYSTRRRAFREGDVAFLQSLANVVALALERHELEIAKRRENEILQAIFDNLPVMLSINDPSGRFLRVNPAWERTLGWTLEEVQRVDLVTEMYSDPEHRQEAREFAQGPERLWADFRPRTRDGRMIDSSWARFELSDHTRIWCGLNTTEPKQAEHALRESEAKFRQLAENISEVFWLTGLDDTQLLYVSPGYEQIFGRTCESLYREPRSWLEAVHPEDRERMRRTANEMASRGEIDETYRIVRRDGSVRWIRDRAFPIRTAAGDVYRFAGVAEDVTDRVRAEEERTRLFHAETRARAAAESALERLRSIQSITDATLAHMALDQFLRELLARLRKALQTEYATVLLLDEKRHVLNVVAHDGFRQEDVPSSSVPVGGTISGRVATLGRALLFNRIPVPDAPEWKARYATLGLRCAMGAPLVVEDRVIGVVSVASTSDRPFTDQDLGLLQVVADRAAPTIERGRLVERVRAGRERLKAMSRRLLTAEEEERRRVAVELHDDLGQVLTAAKINLESAERSSGVGAARSHLKEAIGCVDQAMQSVRDLALDLRPSVLDDLGLAAALRWYVDRFAQKAHWEMHLSIASVAKLESAVETTCFRLAQEALTNVARHAHAAHVWFDLHLSGEEIELRVRDDGIGFDVSAARERAIGGASLGLLGMEERVSLAGGEFEILSAPGTGTEVRARFPLRST